MLTIIGNSSITAAPLTSVAAPTGRVSADTTYLSCKAVNREKIWPAKARVRNTATREIRHLQHSVDRKY